MTPAEIRALAKFNLDDGGEYAAALRLGADAMDERDALLASIARVGQLLGSCARLASDDPRLLPIVTTWIEVICAALHGEKAMLELTGTEK